MGGPRTVGAKQDGLAASARASKRIPVFGGQMRPVNVQVMAPSQGKLPRGNSKLDDVRLCFRAAFDLDCEVAVIARAARAHAR